MDIEYLMVWCGSQEMDSVNVTGNCCTTAIHISNEPLSPGLKKLVTLRNDVASMSQDVFFSILIEFGSTGIVEWTKLLFVVNIF